MAKLLVSLVLLFPLFLSAQKSYQRTLNYTTPCATSSIFESNELDFSIHPNPLIGTTLHLQAAKVGTLIIRTASGSLVFQSTTTVGENKLELPVLSSGVYLIEWVSNDIKLSKKLILE